MTEIGEFVSKLESYLNDDSSGSGRPSSSYGGHPLYFSVRSPSLPFSDSSAGSNVADGSFVVPVMVSQSSPGSYDPYPGIGLFSMSYSVSVIFPLGAYQDILLFFGWLASGFVGRIIDFGPSSGNVCCNIGTPTIGQMQYLETVEFMAEARAVSDVFGPKRTISREWASLNFEFYMSGSDGMGKAGGLIYGNAYEVSISIPSLSVSSGRLLMVAPSDSKVGNTYEQQSLGSLRQKGLETNSAYGSVHTVLMQDTPFWKAVVNAFFGMSMSNLKCSLTKTVYFASGPVSAPAIDYIMRDFSMCPVLGKPMTATFSLEASV